MRKNYKHKRRSCGLCKPNKVGWGHRWTAKELARRQQAQKEARDG